MSAVFKVRIENLTDWIASEGRDVAGRDGTDHRFVFYSRGTEVKIRKDTE